MSSKTHNWVNRIVSFDADVDRATVDAICGCNLLTPAEEARIDSELIERFPLTDSEQKQVTALQDEAVSQEVTEQSWLDQEPTQEQLQDEERLQV